MEKSLLDHRNQENVDQETLDLIEDSLALTVIFELFTKS